MEWSLALAINVAIKLNCIFKEEKTTSELILNQHLINTQPRERCQTDKRQHFNKCFTKRINTKNSFYPLLRRGNISVLICPLFHGTGLLLQLQLQLFNSCLLIVCLKEVLHSRVTAWSPCKFCMKVGRCWAWLGCQRSRRGSRRSNSILSGERASSDWLGSGVKLM